MSSIVLMIYSRSACREYVLPAVHDEEYILSIDSAVFGLPQDLSLHMEEVRGDWYFMPGDDYQIHGVSETQNKNSGSGGNTHARGGGSPQGESFRGGNAVPGSQFAGGQFNGGQFAGSQFNGGQFNAGQDGFSDTPLRNGFAGGQDMNPGYGPQGGQFNGGQDMNPGFGPQGGQFNGGQDINPGFGPQGGQFNGGQGAYPGAGGAGFQSSPWGSSHTDYTDTPLQFGRNPGENAAGAGGNPPAGSAQDDSVEDDGRLLLINGANYTLNLRRERLAVVVRFKETSFMSFRKYLPVNVRVITIGAMAGNIIRYNYSYGGNRYIGRKMAEIRLNGIGAALYDLNSKNGIYVNNRRVADHHDLQFGDHIQIWGLDIVYLGEILAIRDEEDLSIDTTVLVPCLPQKTAFKITEEIFPAPGTELPSQPEDAAPFRRLVYHRAPRSMEPIDTEAVEIEQPPAPREVPEPNLLMTVGPSMTMAIPMALGSVMAILGSRMNGGSSSMFMYTGIVVALGAATIGAFWALMNLNYNQKKARQDEVHRFEAYSEYLTRSSDKLHQSYVSNAEAMRKMYPASGFCVTPDMEAQNLLWGRNSTHGDFLAHRVGMGDIPFQVQINVPKERFSLINDSLNDKPRLIRDSYQTLHDVPICIDLLQENIIGIVGGPQKTGAYVVFYDLVAQLAAQNSYTDVKMAFLFSGGEDHERGREKWDFLRWLPHTWSQDRRMRYFACGQTEITDVLYALSRVLRDRSEQRSGSSSEKRHIFKPHYVLFVEDSSLLEGELISTFLLDRDADLGVTLVLLAESYEDLPNTCECIIGNEDGFRGLYRVREGTREQIVFDTVPPEALNRFARHLSNLEVNEIETGGDIPQAITFFEMYGVSRMEEFGVVDKWRKNRTYVSMRALVGHMAGGAPCYLDVHEKYHGPHGLVAGTTGSGKSETLQTYILSLAINFSPDDVGFFLIDYKGGGMANLFEKLPHIMGTISNLSGNQVTRAMVSIKSENRRRQRLFNESGVNNINAYTQLYKNGEAKVPVPHLFIIIDEFAELKREQPDFMKELISVAQVGRSLGVHLILATQKPAGTVDDNIWSNSKFRLCLRVQDRQDSMDMLHKPDAAYLTQAGRCYLQVGNDELYELFQSGWSGAVYDETDVNARKTLATMLTGTGKAALMGSYVKRRQKENQKIRWIGGLLELVDKCRAESGSFDDKTGDRALDFTGEKIAAALGVSAAGGASVVSAALMDRFFAMLAENGIDYSDTEYNRRGAALLFRMSAQASGEQPEWEQMSYEEKAGVLIDMESRQNARLPEEKDRTQLDAVIDYLARVAEKEGYAKPQKLWLPVLPTVLPLSRVTGLSGMAAESEAAAAGFHAGTWPSVPRKWSLSARVGMYDDPANQAQEALEINFTEAGNIAVCGMQGTGRSTSLQTILCSLGRKYSPQYVGYYILDFSSKMLACFEDDPHCGGILYDNDIDTVNKFFNMLSAEIRRRSQLFSGGNYYQYVTKNGVTLPALIIAIDNYGGFREKTNYVYDEVIKRFTKSCNAYGIYFLLSAAGFNKDEIPNNMHDNLHYTIALEMMDKFAYGDVLGVMRVTLLPENGIPGRGLVSVSGELLEFQMAVAAEADDDYQRQELLAAEFRTWASAWKGETIRRIPRIPEKPTWELFESTREVRDLAADGIHLPVGYLEDTADIYGIDLREIYTWLVQGKNKKERRKVLQLLAKSAALRGGRVTVIEPDDTQWKSFSQEEDFEYVSGFEEYTAFFNERYAPDFVRRNKIKKECLEKGMTDEKIFQTLAEEETRYLVITDLCQFVQMLHTKEGKLLEAQMTNLLDKGFLHNIYVFSAMSPDDKVKVLDNSIYTTFTSAKIGIHLGNVSENKIFDFSTVPFSLTKEAARPGRGVTAPTETEDWHKLVLPVM